MRRRYLLTQKTLFTFLSATGLPLVGNLARLIRWVTLVLGSAGMVFGVGVLAFAEQPLWNAGLPWSGAFPVLVASPLFLVAHSLSRRQRMQGAAVATFAGLFALCALASWLRGPFAPAWLAQPILAALATISLGAVAGLSLTVAGVVALLGCALRWGSIGAATAASVPAGWGHASSLAAVTLASGLVGVLLHELLLAALGAAEQQRDRILESRRALRHREKLLRHALRVDTVGELAGMVVHQLRNYFQVMMGNVAMATRGDAEERTQRLSMIGEALDAARPLLDQLMDMAHPEDSDPIRADLSDLVVAFCDGARRVLPSALEVKLETSPSSLPVLLDRRGLEHALWNLVINATQAMGAHGVITIATVKEGTMAWLLVQDTGIGIPDDQQRKIFEPYFTTKPVGSGTGLGLTAVSRFARACRGRIEVESEVGVGSTFRLGFPLQMTTAAVS